MVLVLSVVSSNHVMTTSVLSGERWFMKQHASSDIPEDRCICRPHRREAKRNQSDPEHIPIWKKGDQGLEHVTACMNPECSATSLTECLLTKHKKWLLKC